MAIEPEAARTILLHHAILLMIACFVMGWLASLLVRRGRPAPTPDAVSESPQTITHAFTEEETLALADLWDKIGSEERGTYSHLALARFWQTLSRMVPTEHSRCKMTLDNTTSKSRWRVTIYPQGPVNP